MATLIYPTNAELTQVGQVKAPKLTMDDPIFEILPVENRDTTTVMWEQEDDYTGLQQVRGKGGVPSRVKRTGAKSYSMKPGVYGEFELIDEEELMERRKLGSFGETIDVTDLVMRKQDKLLSRRIDRQRATGWTLLTTGSFSVANQDGTVMHTDSFSLQTFTATVPWATYATATPLNDFRAVQLLSRGKGVRFDGSATAYVNRVTFNDMLKNANASDIAGRRTNGLNTLLALNGAELNTILLGEDLPQIKVYDEGYINDAGTWTPFIANAKAVVVGTRVDGSPIGNYLMTRNPSHPTYEPGAYSFVIDHGGQAVPRTIEVHDGHNGAPVIYFPSAIVIMNV